MTAIQCTELPALDLGGTSDPYVKVNMKEGERMYGSIRGAEGLEGKDGAGCSDGLGFMGGWGCSEGESEGFGLMQCWGVYCGVVV